MAVKEVGDNNFAQEVLQSSIPVVVDFWAPWCGPCQSLMPILEGWEKEVTGKVKVVKLNIDDNQSTAAQYGVRSIPTLLLFDKGKMVSTKVGAVPKAKLQEWVQQLNLL